MNRCSRFILVMEVIALLVLRVFVTGFVTSPSFRRSFVSSSQRLDSTPFPRVLCVGEALLDCISNQNGLSAQDMMAQEAWTAFPGGASANVATACSKLGTRTGFCGCVGQDKDGDYLESVFQQCGVVHVSTLLQKTTNHPTRRVLVTRDENGDRSFAGFDGNLATDLFADCFLNATDLFSKDGNAVDSILAHVEWISCGTLSLACPQSRDSILEIVKAALNKGAKLCVDVNWRPIFWQCQETEARAAIVDFVQKAHIVKLTDEEAEWLVDDTNVTAAFALEYPGTLHKEHFPNALAVFVTAGENGASYSIRSPDNPKEIITGQIPSFHVKAVDTTGAGDGFSAGILHGLVQNNVFAENGAVEDPPAFFHDLVTFASSVGALTCTSEGAIAAQPTMAQVESFLVHGEKVWV